MTPLLFQNDKTIQRAPLLMAILNITPDSFFPNSRCANEKEILTKVEQLVLDGADIIDIGAYSSRPNAAFVNEGEEQKRLFPALELIRSRFPEIPVSIDTFRSKIARRAVTEFNASIINDISGGTLDKDMFCTIADLKVSYVLMHMKGTPQTMHELTAYNDFMSDVMDFFEKQLHSLRALNVKDVILDPGFGFAKTLEQNYFLLKNTYLLKKFGLPILIGISRKSMIFKALGISPEDALNGTTVLNTLALGQGADILRVHDVKEAKEAITLYNLYNSDKLCYSESE